MVGQSREILHVIESFGGGSLNALLSFVRATPELAHHIVFGQREGEYAADGELALFESRTLLPRGHAAAIRAVRRRVQALQPQVVHAHSSFAGLYVRLAIRNGPAQRVVYSPHCFAFERQDLPALTRGAIRLVEQVLSYNTGSLAACSTREYALAARWAFGSRTFVPNVPRSLAASLELRTAAPRVSLVGAGRLSVQKDPIYFSDVVATVRETFPDLHAVWVGDGDPAEVERLKRASITVTGWLPQAEAMARLARAEVYVHSAAWEGFPLTVLEANAVSCPIVCRSIPPLATAPAKWVGSTPAQVAAGVVRLLEGGVDGRRSNLADWNAYLDVNNPRAQRQALQSAYGVAQS